MFGLHYQGLLRAIHFATRLYEVTEPPTSNLRFLNFPSQTVNIEIQGHFRIVGLPMLYSKGESRSIGVARIVID